MGTHLYDSFHSLERILEGNQELRKEVLTMFGGHVEFNGCNILNCHIIIILNFLKHRELLKIQGLRTTTKIITRYFFKTSTKTL